MLTAAAMYPTGNGSDVSRRACAFSRARFAFLRATTCCALLAGGVLRAERLVTVRAVADASYMMRRGASEDPPAETYILAKGQRTEGADTALMKIPFRSIVPTLASDLLVRNYVPATNADNVDLVIVVHWGMTNENQNSLALLQYDPDALRQAAEAVTEAKEREAADISGVQRALGASAQAEANFNSEAKLAESLYQTNSRAQYSNAGLLGFKPGIDNDDNLGETLRSMANEERYFVILVAYDAKALRDKKKQQVWVTRMSIRAGGVNFPIALDRMSVVAARFNGTRQPAIILQDSPKKGRELTKVDSVIVLGDNAPQPATKKR